MRFIGLKNIYEDEALKDTPYLTRAWIGRLYVHVFHRGDNDPDPHDHPRDFWTFPLTSYVEEVTHLEVGKEPWQTLNLVRAFRLHYRPAEYAHRVLGRASRSRYVAISDENGEFVQIPVPESGKIITIVWWRTKKYKREWGFLKNRNGAWCWVAWRDYILGGGKHGPCEDDE